MFRKLSVLAGRIVVATAALAGLAASAWAQDYTISVASGMLETRPSSGTTALNQASTSTSTGLSVDLPFELHYYGRRLSRLWVGPSGYLIANPDITTIFANPHRNSGAPGRSPTSNAFPYTPQGTNGSASPNADGLIAAFWDSINIYTGTPPVGDTYWWIVGAAPNRRFVVSWENFEIQGSTSGIPITAQVHLHETTGRIVLAYTTTGDYSRGRYVCGIDSYGDARFTSPVMNSNTNTGHPGADFILDPTAVTYSGTLLFDKIVSDANGIGPGVSANRPIPSCRVELRRNSDSFVWASTTTASDGSFSVTGIGLPAATPGTIAVLAQNAACRVSATLGGTVTQWVLDGSRSFVTGENFGTLTLGVSGDANADVRAALNVASACIGAHAWASVRTTDTIPPLDVLLDPASTAATAYQKAVDPAPAAVRIGSRQASNPDAWDDAVVSRTYGRHVLASIAGTPSTAVDHRFDMVSDGANAFAEAFGYALWAAVSGTSQAIDGTGPTTAVVYDLENPSITVTKGPDVAGCMAAALFDLIDGANETIDVVDGTSNTDRVLRAADSLAVAPNSSTFLQAWATAGYDASGITRAFVGNGALDDDTAEPNDDRDESLSLGAVGVKRTGLVLNRFNEDWFTVTVDSAAPALVADAKYDQLTTGAAVGVEIRDAAGALVGTGALQPLTGAVHAATGAIAAGTYRIGVRHLSGGRVPTYTFQACVPPSLDAVPVRDWTVGRPYDFPIGSRDGIAPYLSTTGTTALPPGLGLNQPSQRVIGTPSTVGEFLVTLQIRDGGDPANITSSTRVVTIHDVLEIPVAPFVGFPAGKPLALSLPTTGGTPPFALTVPVGALPAGLSFAPGTFDVTGTAAAQTSTRFELDGVDVAGSANYVATRGVVAVELNAKNVPASLAAGDDACCWWFDAVKGSAVSFKAATAKGSPKRVLTGAVLAPDRSEVTTATVKPKTGSLSVTKLVCPESGRYYVIAASAAGEAAQLLGNVAVAAPKGGATKLADFAPSDTTTIEFGALAGATLSLKFAGDKKQSLTARILSVTDPNGTPVNFGAFVTTSGVGGTLAMPLPTGGTWTVVLGATSTTGNPGKFSASYKLKQPKGGVFSDD